MEGAQLFISIAKVSAVLVVLVFALRLLSRNQRGRSGVRVPGGRNETAPLMEIVDQSRIGRSGNAVALRVGERVLLLGVTETGIETLADITADIDLTADEQEDPSSSVLDHAVDLLRTGNFRR